MIPVFIATDSFIRKRQLSLLPFSPMIGDYPHLNLIWQMPSCHMVEFMLSWPFPTQWLIITRADACWLLSPLAWDLQLVLAERASVTLLLETPSPHFSLSGVRYALLIPAPSQACVPVNTLSGRLLFGESRWTWVVPGVTQEHGWFGDYFSY